MDKGTFPAANFDFCEWQIDGAAPCDKAKKTQEYLKENMGNLRGKDMWPPKSPNLNSWEYRIWAYMEHRGFCI